MRAPALWGAAVAAVAAVAAASLPADRLSLQVTAGPVARRYCTCHDKGDRQNATFQTCTIKKNSLHGLVCTTETRPYVSRFSIYSPGIRGIYTLYSTEKYYYEAEDVCAEENARLAVPLNKQGYNDLYAEMKKRLQEYALLGISDRRVEGTFVDSDGAKPPYLPWAEGQPDNKDGQDCVWIEGQSHIFDRSCYYRYSPFVCERRMSKRIPSGYTYRWSDGRFYKYYKEKKSHAEARLRCQQDGGTLVAFESWMSAEVIPALMAPPEDHWMWTDYTDQEVEGQFVTSTGLLMDDTNYIYWHGGQPDNGGKKHSPQNCVYMQATGEYYDGNCSDQKNFLCQIKQF